MVADQLVVQVVVVVKVELLLVEPVVRQVYLEDRLAVLEIQVAPHQLAELRVPVVYLQVLEVPAVQAVEVDYQALVQLMQTLVVVVVVVERRIQAVQEAQEQLEFQAAPPQTKPEIQAVLVAREQMS